MDSQPTSRGTCSVNKRQDPSAYLRLVFSCIYALIAALLVWPPILQSVKTSTDKELTVGEGDKEVQVSGGVQKVTVGVK